jgi:hypothetical protein
MVPGLPCWSKGNGPLDRGPTCRRCSLLLYVLVRKGPDMSEKMQDLGGFFLVLTCRRIRKAVIKWQKRSITRERGERMHSSYNFVILTWEVALLRSAVARRGSSSCSLSCRCPATATSLPR